MAEPEELAEIYQRLNTIDADRAPAKAAEILSGLGFSNDDLTRPMAEFRRLAHGARARRGLVCEVPNVSRLTSRPITSILRAHCGWKRGCRNIRIPR